jgi:histidinol-phosphatase
MKMEVKPTSDDDLTLALQLADAASAISLSHFRRPIRRWSKTDGSLATEADLAVEDAIRTRLGVERSGDAVLGEERGQTGSANRRWIVDGIDGTVDFAAGTNDWGTLIALEVDGRVVVGVCDQPAHKRRYWAVRGHGAFISHESSVTERRRLNVSTVRDIQAARSFVPAAEWVRDERAGAIAAALTSATKPEPPVEHPALQVATGGYDIAIFLIAGPWDLAAPLLVVEEAGGRFTDIDGRYDWTTGSAVFSNGHLHDDVIRIAAST